ncbi:MAG: ECF-type sigma factor [Bryobacteraceae bacterium]|jgi:RNA polymerase sigma factor (TIGR02999 family)
MAEESLTELLRDFRSGDRAALDRLIPMVYAESRRLAANCLRQERTGHTLQPTALVHECYMRLLAQQPPEYQSRSHFYGVAAQVMRQILVDHARTRNAAKRGGGSEKLSLDEAWHYSEARAASLIELDDALAALEQVDARRARMVEMRYFGGLTAEESGEVLGIPAQQVYRELRVAQAWLQRELDRRPSEPS